MSACIIDVYLKTYDIICLSETLTDCINLSTSIYMIFSATVCLEGVHRDDGVSWHVYINEEHIFAYSEKLFDTIFPPSIIGSRFKEKS